MKNATRCLAVLLVICAAAPERAAADDRKGKPPGRPPGPGEDLIARVLFPPEMIMHHQAELGIDEKQRAAIIKEVEKAQGQILQLQWKLQAAAEQLVKLLEAPRIDEAKALEQSDKVMAFERQVKRTHLGLLIRIKNLLTDAQRAKLTEIRKRAA
ncbi:MAG: periplasmic heavy metal sensor [Deltaproteobacteria bacterium]|nr:periplasmic heavy metal sensor [Deltaproteobacteria bacterium]